MPNVSSHITIKITKSFRHFCFIWIYFFFYQTIKYIVTGRCRCTRAKYLRLFGAQKALIMQLAPQTLHRLQEAAIDSNKGTWHVAEIHGTSFKIWFPTTKGCVFSTTKSRNGYTYHQEQSSDRQEARPLWLLFVLAVIIIPQ